MEDVQRVQPAPSIVALLPRADPPAPVPPRAPKPHIGHIGSNHIWAVGQVDGNRSKSDSQCVSPSGDSPQIVIDNRPPFYTADGLVRTECQRTFPRLNDANRHYSTKYDKPIPCPNPGCRDTFPRRSDYLVRHLFCNSACMTKASEIDTSPEVPMEWCHRRDPPKSRSIIKSALEKVVKLRIQSNGLQRATITKRARHPREIDIVDDSWNESGCTRIMIAELG